MPVARVEHVDLACGAIGEEEQTAAFIGGGGAAWRRDTGCRGAVRVHEVEPTVAGRNKNPLKSRRVDDVVEVDRAGSSGQRHYPGSRRGVRIVLPGAAASQHKEDRDE